MFEASDSEEAIFDAALQISQAEARAAYLSKVCGDDRTLHDRVMALLDAHAGAGAGGFLDNPLSGFRLAAAAAGLVPPAAIPSTEPREMTEKPGDHIGRYRLLQRIGEGGCGVVYMAEQEQPVRRRVALKIIKLGMDTRQVIARFEAERQALAMMDHPNIARVLDAGATETGRPFFVMDLVRGIRITEYCDQHGLGTRERLVLFQQVCHAIQHAHQKGIIHRDIKPSNILVTLHNGQPVPVIIDFGIAKATEQRLTDKTLFTAFEQLIGTPVYMSPEQAEMSRLDIDTRSDIYSLGVLLYELLTGRTAFDAKALVQSGLEEMRRTIREKEPLRPSTCLSTMLQGDLAVVAKQRGSEPLKLIHVLRGDLDWIVMKCLEKDRTRRYETANALSMDVERYLRNEPVLARPPSGWYRFQKLVRRNKVAFGAGSAVALALIVGLAVSTWLYMREREAYRRAVQAEQNQSRLRQEAEAASARERTERRNSEESARQSRLSSYAADISSAFQALQEGNLGRAVDLLEQQVPASSKQSDLRGFEWRYLWAQAQGDELLSLPHPALVSCALFSPDGRSLVTAAYDGVVRVWDLASRQVMQSLSGFEQQFGWRYVTLSPDGRWLAGIHQGKVGVWQLQEATFKPVLEVPSSVRVIAFTPDGTRLVGWGETGLVIMETGTWTQTNIPTKLVPGSYPCLAIDRPGQLVALAHEREHAIEIVDLEGHSLPKVFTFERHSGNAFVSLAWSPHGLLAAATWSGQLFLLDGRTGAERASVHAHAGSVFGLVFSPDASTLVSAGHDQLIQFWEVPALSVLNDAAATNTALTRLSTFHGHRDEIWSLAIAPDGRRLCTAGKDGTAKLWSLERKPPTVFLNNWFAGAFSADGKAFVTLSDPTTELAVDYWAVDNPAVRTAKTLPVKDLKVKVILSPDAKLLALAKEDGTVEVWSLDASKVVTSMQIPLPAPTSLAFAQGNRTLAIGTAQGTVQLWDLKTGQVLELGRPQKGRVSDLQFSPGNYYLIASLESRKHQTVWSLSDHREVQLPAGIMQPFAFSPDGRTLAAPGTNYTVKLWDLPSLGERATLAGHRWTIYAIAFSPDSQRLATGSLDAVARIWDVGSGRELTRPLRGHLQGIVDLTFSPDGRSLATASTDGTVKLWHVLTGRELFSLEDASQARFSPDGNSLLLNTSLGTRLWHVPSLVDIDAARTGELVEARPVGSAQP